jgi:hypothetical protein
MDGGGGSHYVRPLKDPTRLELLLFLSAMLAGLTGFISGDRAVDARQLERTAVAAAAAAIEGQTQAEAVSVAEASPAAAVFAISRENLPRASAALPAQAAPVDERRLE